MACLLENLAMDYGQAKALSFGTTEKSLMATGKMGKRMGSENGNPPMAISTKDNGLTTGSTARGNFKPEEVHIQESLTIFLNMVMAIRFLKMGTFIKVNTKTGKLLAKVGMNGLKAGIMREIL